MEINYDCLFARNIISHELVCIIKTTMKSQKSKILYFPHGGGPLPLLGDPGHSTMIDFLKNIIPTLGNPKAILLISAHWEERDATITGGKYPELIYDYYGFPEESYNIKYPAPGIPELAEKVFQLLNAEHINARIDTFRGFDHGMFVPLKIMYPKANIPCIQLSLLEGLDPEVHIKMGNALSKLKNENILILGSGFSFHNLRSLLTKNQNDVDPQNEKFEDWLINTCTSQDISEDQREQKLTEWQNAPYARYCHPREEHLMPLHVCYGIAKSPAKLVFNNKILGKRASAYLW